MNLRYFWKIILIFLLLFRGEFLFSKRIQEQTLPYFDTEPFQGKNFFRKSVRQDNRKKKIDKIKKPKKSKLELGVGFLSFKIPHYRGSDQKKDYFLPLPFFIYSSKNVTAEPSFVRGTFFRKGAFALKLSILAGLSVESRTNRARQGMPNLGFTIETGPMIEVRLWTSQNKKHFINLEAPFRYVIEIDSTPKGIGVFAIPYFNWVNRPRKETWNWGSEISFAGLFADENYHDHYYSVGPDYVRPGRPQYAARGGI